MLKPKFDPFPVLETERMILRRFVGDDAQKWFELRRDIDSMRFIDRTPPVSVEEIHQLIRKVNDNIDNSVAIAWVAVSKSSGEMLGNYGFHRNDFENHRAEVGYQFFPRFWKQGYGAEGLSAVLDYGFSVIGLHSVMANINPSNDASRALLVKFGFKQEAYFRENYYFNGKFLDSAIYCLLQSEFKRK